jgi:hypothetical protein
MKELLQGRTGSGSDAYPFAPHCQALLVHPFRRVVGQDQMRIHYRFRQGFLQSWAADAVRRQPPAKYRERDRTIVQVADFAGVNCPIGHPYSLVAAMELRWRQTAVRALRQAQNSDQSAHRP